MNILLGTPIGRGRYAGAMVGPDPLIRRFGLLFQGRLDAVGGDDGRAIYEPYTYGAVATHLAGENPIGVYPTWPDENGARWTRWGCCDIDTGDWREAFQLATALDGMGLRPHVERSRSKGWHIWVFVPTPVEAWQMRRCLKVAYAAIDLPAKEANPKSEQLAPAQLGNYVRQPFKGALNNDQQLMDEREHRLAGGTTGGRGSLLRSSSVGPTGRGGDCPTNDGPGRCGEISTHSRSAIGNDGRQSEALSRQELEEHLHLEAPAERTRHGGDVGDPPVHGRTQEAADRNMLSSLEKQRGPSWKEGSFRQCMMRRWDSIHDGEPYSWREWMQQVGMTDEVYSDPKRIAHWASKWYERPRKSSDFDPSTVPTDVSSLVESLDPGWRAKYLEGTATDRSETIVALAYWCARRGWPAKSVYALLWWSPWNKYRDRQDGERYVMDIVDRAYS